MPACPTCASTLVQALRWEHAPGGALDVGLRCPECQSCFRTVLGPVAVRDLEASQAAARDALRETYERVVSESMEALAACLAGALARDLVTADDFAPRPPAG